MRRNTGRHSRSSCWIKVLLGLTSFFYIIVVFTFVKRSMWMDVYSQHDLLEPPIAPVASAAASPQINTINDTDSVNSFSKVNPGEMNLALSPTVTSRLYANFDVGLETERGLIRINLYNSSDNQDAWRFFNESLAHYIQTGESFVPCNHCNFYRAEPVPSTWGSTSLPDSSFGGRWGPPYALLQGSMGPNNPKSYDKQVKEFTNGSNLNLNRSPVQNARPGPKGSPSVRPSIKRGMVAWAGGGGGPHFFIALADHPEWGHAHTVFGEVLPTDMTTVVAQIMTMQKSVHVPKQHKERPTITNLVTPVPFSIQPGYRPSM